MKTTSLLLLALATTVSINSTQKSLFQKLAHNTQPYLVHGNEFMIGCLAGATARTVLYGIKTVTQPADDRSCIVDLATTFVGGSIALCTADGIAITIDHLEEKILPKTPITGPDKNFLRGLGFWVGGAAANTFLYRNN